MKRILTALVFAVFGFLVFSSYSFAGYMPCAAIITAETYYTPKGPYLRYTTANHDDIISLSAEPVLISVSFDEKICIYRAYDTLIAQAIIFVPTLELKDAWETAIRDVRAAYQKYLESQDRQFPSLVPVYRGRK